MAGWGWTSSSGGGTYGAGIFSADVCTAGFGFSGGGHNVFGGLVEGDEGDIDEITINPTEVVLDGGTTAGLRLDKIGVVGGDFDNRITSIILDDSIWIYVDIVHAHVWFSNFFGHGQVLFRGYLVEGRKNAWVVGVAVV